MNELYKRILSSLVIAPIVISISYIGSVYFILLLALMFIIAAYELYNLMKNKFFFILGLTLILFSFYSAYNLRYSTYLNINHFYLFLFIILICISTDIGGYTFGKIFKGPKFKIISPNKTYSGVAGSFTLSLIIGFIFLKIFDLFQINDLFNYRLHFFIIIFISLISQFGDLTISFVKRLNNLKDTGNILPGHGGLLDRIDGMIFVFPILNIFINYV